jgi:vesicle transport through interaction with t-SNAREs protein 1
MSVSRADEEGYQKLENNWQAVSQSFARKLRAITDSNNVQLQHSLLLEAQADANDAQAALDALESEARHFPYSLRTRAQKSITAHTSELEKNMASLKRYENSINKGQVAGVSHMDLVGRMGAGDHARYVDNRQQLLQGNQIISESDASLSRTQQALAETEEVGAATSAQLMRQREQFQNQLANVHETDDFLSRSKRTLNRMNKRIVTNKLITGAIILVEMGACALIVWMKSVTHSE